MTRTKCAARTAVADPAAFSRRRKINFLVKSIVFMHFNLSRTRLLLRPFAAAAAASAACSSYCLSLASNWPAVAAACNIGSCRPGKQLLACTSAIGLHQRYWPAKVAIGRYWRRPRRARHQPICVASSATFVRHKLGTKVQSGPQAVAHGCGSRIRSVCPAGPAGPPSACRSTAINRNRGTGDTVLLQCCCSAVAVLLRNWGIGVTRGLGLRNQGRE